MSAETTPRERGGRTAGLDALAVVLGSAASPWPVLGCCCRACLSEPPERRRAPSGLLLDGVVLDGVLPAEGGRPAEEPLPRVTTGGSDHLVAGQGLQFGAWRLAALPAASLAGQPDSERAVVVAVNGGRGLLWAPGCGPLPEETIDALAGAGLEAAALDTRGPDGVPAPLRVAHDLARLRAVGALAAGCDVVAVGLTHEVAPGPLAARLARWGARLAPDGAALGSTQAAEPEPARRTLVLGGAASGKSALAEDLLAAEPAVTYLATGRRPESEPGTHDAAWAARVAAHRRRRPAWWSTVETSDVAAQLRTPGPPVLVDSLGTWATAALTACGAWDGADGWERAWQDHVDQLVDAWRATPRRSVAVSEEVGWGVVPGTPSGMVFRDAMGGLNRRVAQESEQVLLVVAGRALDLSADVTPWTDKAPWRIDG